MSQTSTVGKLDKAGATASLVCAIHCITLPLLFAIVPAVGLTWLDNPWFDRAFLIAAMVFVLLAHPRGYIRHRRCIPAILATCGIIMVVLAVSLWENVVAHHYLVAVGGVIIASSHWLNRHYFHHACCEGHHHGK
ncbi:MAG: MerC domain-containing protein [Acidobacteriia bacterium]|nr:MerC domain-containing protein [Terriglobia bacterium]